MIAAEAIASIGKPAQRGSQWRSRGAQERTSCRTFTAPAYPGVYGMIVDGGVKRIAVGKRSTAGES
jgi:hypothetical protein